MKKSVLILILLFPEVVFGFGWNSMSKGVDDNGMQFKRNETAFEYYLDTGVGCKIELSSYAPRLYSKEANEIFYIGKHLIIAEPEDVDYQFMGSYTKRPSSLPSYPTFRVYSDVDMQANEYVQLSFSGDGVISTGLGRVYINPASKYLTFGTPDGASGVGSIGFQHQLKIIADSDTDHCIVFTGQSQRLEDFSALGQQSYPIFYFGGSNSSGTTSPTNFLYMYHTGTGVIGTLSGDITLSPNSSSVTINNVLKLNERTSDPVAPPEGKSIVWMSDGTGYGDDGDVCIASTAGGVTRKTILFDHSAGDSW